MKFSNFTDAHLTGQTPSGRKDNFADSILSKVRQIYKVSKDEGVEFVLFSGDMFNTHKVYSYNVITSLIEIMRESGLKTFFIMGQHDLYGYESSTYEDSALRFVATMLPDQFILIENHISLNKYIDTDIDCDIYASHVQQDIFKKIQTARNNGKFNILVAHVLLSKDIKMFDIIKTSDLLKNNFNVVLSGDLHDGYEYHVIDGTAYYNPGAIARTKNSDTARDLKFAIFDVSELLGTYDIKINEIKLDHKEPEEVFYEKEEEMVSSVDDFVLQMDELEKNAVDIFDLIDMAYRKYKDEMNVDEKMMNYILKFRKDEK